MRAAKGAVALGSLVAVGLGASVAVAQISPPPPLISAYAVLGLGDVTIRTGSRVLSGAVGSVGGTVRLGPQARVTSAVAGPTVRLGLGSHTGPLFCHLVSGPPTLPSCNAFADPLLAPALLGVVAVVPGATDLRLPAHTGTAPVPAGNFRDVRVGAGSVLTLYGGAYSARSLRVGPAARVVCTTECRIGVAGPVRIGHGAEIGAAVSTHAEMARIDVAATGAVPAFIARARSNVSATVFAPGGRVILGRLGMYRGAFVGASVAVGARVTVRGDSAL